ncbi:MAG: MATE family efflux transporter, partial [Mycoplasmatales bacterium]
INQLYGFIDMSFASELGAQSVSSIVFIDQIIVFIQSIGYGLGISGGVIIAKYMGANLKTKTSEFITVVFIMTVLIGITISIIGSVFPEYFLSILKLPSDLVSVGTNYFIIQLITVMFVYFNAAYFGLERARGNSNKILILNVITIFAKVILLLIISYMNMISIELIAITTFLAQLFITVCGLYSTLNKKQTYKFEIKYINLKIELVKELLYLGIPIIISRSIFSLGKLIVNVQSAYYGAVAIGALGISNKLSGIVASFAMGFEEAESIVISANRGAKNYDKILEIMKKTLIVSFLLGVFGYFFMLFFYHDIISFFAKNDQEFYLMLDSIFKYEIMGLFLLPIINSITGVLYGMGRSRITLILSFIRLFVLRIPIIWIFIAFTSIGPSALGFSMLISNITSALLMIGAYIYYIQPIIKKEKKER